MNSEKPVVPLVFNFEDTELLKSRTSDCATKMQFFVCLSWRSVRRMALLHLFALLGFKHALFDATWGSLAAVIFYITISVTGIGTEERISSYLCGDEPFRSIIALLRSIFTQNAILEYVRDRHRRHKEIDNSRGRRGSLLAHIGKMFISKHPDVTPKGAELDLSELYSDPVKRFQKRYSCPLLLLCSVILPVMVVVLLFGERMWYAFTVVFALRCTLMLHMAWLLDSAKNSLGFLLEDAELVLCDSPVTTTVLSFGEEGLNIHHSVPLKQHLKRFHEDTWQRLAQLHDLQSYEPSTQVSDNSSQVENEKKEIGSLPYKRRSSRWKVHFKN